MKNKVILFLSFLCAGSPAFCNENYYSNVLSPIPPACATLVNIWDNFNASGRQTLASGTIQLVNLKGEEQNVTVTIWQKGCPESGRRVLMMRLAVVNNLDEDIDYIITPELWGSGVAGDPNRKRMRPVLEPNSHYTSDESRLIEEKHVVDFFIDTVSGWAPAYESGMLMNPLQYNQAWTLEIEDSLTGVWVATIPAYNNLLQPERMALTGRLSGNWVIPGIPDQGFVLAFGESATEAAGVFFLSWYTYDAQGKPLWLTGSNFYALDGTGEVSFEILFVTNGQFMGTKLADRHIVGTGTLRAINCNDLRLTYDLRNMGLGADTVPLVRIISLEIQGYACGDLATRLAHIEDGS